MTDPKLTMYVDQPDNPEKSVKIKHLTRGEGEEEEAIYTILK